MNSDEAIIAHLRGPCGLEEVSPVEEGHTFTASAVDALAQRKVFVKAIQYVAGYEEEILREPRLLAAAVGGAPAPEHVVRLYSADVQQLDGEPYLILQMEYVEGVSLRRRLETDGGLGQRSAVKYGLQLVHGSNGLHARRVLHRDVKPGNIMLRDDGHLLLSDLGSARLLEAGKQSIVASRHSSLYVPPECWKALPEYTVASDIYQCGMVLYEMVSGPLKTTLEHYLSPSPRTRFAEVDEGIKWLSERGKLLEHGMPAPAWLSPRLARLIRKATHPNPSSRYASAGDLHAALAMIEVPDWRHCGTEAGEATATGWRGYDWEIREAAGERFVPARRKAGTDRPYRRVSAGESDSIELCARHVERA